MVFEGCTQFAEQVFGPFAFQAVAVAGGAGFESLEPAWVGQVYERLTGRAERALLAVAVVDARDDAERAVGVVLGESGGRLARLRPW